MGQRAELPGSNLYGLSNDLWATMPLEAICAGFGDRMNGFGIYDDFLRFNPTSLADGYIILSTGSGTTLAPITSEAHHPGIVRLLMDGDAADDENVLQLGAGVDVGAFKFAATDLCFEAYVRIGAAAAGDAITDDNWAWFLGLATGGAAGAAITNLMMADTEPTIYATNSFVGFQKLVIETTALDGMYQLTGQTKVDGAVNTDLNAILTVAEATWYKLGLRYEATRKRLGWWVNGVELCHIGAAALDAAAFPDAVFLQPTIGAKTHGTSGDLYLDIDWWACAQRSS